MLLAGRQVVRVAGVLLCRHHRARVADQSRLLEPAGHRVLDLELGDGVATAYPLGYQVERPVLDGVEYLGRRLVGRELRRVPDRLEPLDQITG